MGDADAGPPPFYEETYRRAQAQIQRIRGQIPYFPSPPLRVQRVGQLDAELLDHELTELLAEPVKASLRNLSHSFETHAKSELYLLLRLVLFKFSIYDHGATYGAMLQNLKYRNEWAHRRACTCRGAPPLTTVQSTAVDAPLTRTQLTLYPLLTILLPYALDKAKVRMSDRGFAHAPASSDEHMVWTGFEQAQQLWNAASLLNFALFLWNGKCVGLALRR